MKKITLVLLCITTLMGTQALVSKTTNSGILLYRLRNAFLIQASSEGDEQLALALLSLPAINLSHRDKNGKTAYNLAHNNDLHEIEMLFENY